VASVIARRLEFEPLTISLIARHLGMSVRTVQRHLGLWDVSFEALLDQYRRQHALELLRQRRLSVTDTAFRLGYSDSGHFTRAFKRWFGVPPSRCAEVPSSPPGPSLRADF
jgi:AraC-like DNA-binding protein